jgi:hypothetical protein
MRIDRVTGDGWWRIFRLGSLARPRAYNGDNGKHLSQPVTCHPFDAEVKAKTPGVRDFPRPTL